LTKIDPVLDVRSLLHVSNQPPPTTTTTTTTTITITKNKNTINDQTSFLFFPNGFLPAVHGADTLRVVGSYHDPTTCKVVVLPNK
jgi:hypothetical protein